MIWLAATPDKYELPIAVADSAEALAKLLGIKGTTVHTLKHRLEKGKLKGESRRGARSIGFTQ